MKLKPGAEAQMKAFADEETNIKIPGLVSTIIYKLDSGNDEYIMAVVFDSKENYWKNAQSPEQDARYRKFRELLSEDPAWMDGDIVYNA
jgi:antibiotic biosynthesis monooxygenase (ABM) superfamily enzyme